MRAVVIEGYGPPQALHLVELERPVPKDEEVLVSVRASSVNAADIDQLRGRYMIRFGGAVGNRQRILGSDVAGRVESVGSRVRELKAGDEVFGDLTEWGFSAFAEYVCVPEAALVPKPVNLGFEEAASAPTAGGVALLNLGAPEGIPRGHRVLINGAGGGMGSFAVQIAKHYGAEVTGVDSGDKLDAVEAAGADHVLDYRREDFTRRGERYDFILDLAARHSIFESRRALAADGRYRFVGGSAGTAFQAALLGPIVSTLDDRKLGILMAYPKRPELTRLRELLQTGAVRPVIDRVFQFQETAEAMQYFESGSVKGKVVIVVRK